MPSHRETPPAAAFSTAMKALEHVGRARAALSPPAAALRRGLVEGEAGAGPETLGSASPVYVVSVADIARRRSLAGAALAAWRYTVLRGARPSGVLELRKAGRALKFSKLHEGGRSAESEAALEAAGRHAASAGRVALRFLRIPSLNLLLAWGHDEEAGSDVLVPVPPAPAPFDQLGPLSASGLVEAILALDPRGPPRRGGVDPTLPVLPRSAPRATGRVRGIIRPRREKAPPRQLPRPRRPTPA